jgi:acyl-CoA dehydrogenase
MRWLISETADRIFREQSDKDFIDAAESGTWPEQMWLTVEDAGLTLAAVPEEFGGAGGALGDAMAVLREAGRHAVPLPLAETYLAGWALSGAGRNVPHGPLTVVPAGMEDEVGVRRETDAWVLSGKVRRVPFAARSASIVVVADDGSKPIVAMVSPRACRIRPGKSLAGEPRDEVDFDGVKLAADDVFAAGEGVDVRTLQQLGALTRAVLMAGALDTILSMTVQHAADREQFDRPIGKFQAVRQQVAVLGGEVAAAGRAANDAVIAAERGDARLQIAAAKTRVGEAAGVCAEISHQLHGAIGFTYEHSLHQFTRRLWSWRDEFGPEAYWAAQLGSSLAEQAASDVWAFVTGMNQRAGDE